MAKIMNASPESPVELVTVDRPEAGETLTVQTASGQQIVLAFNPHDVRFSVAGDDFILTFEDGALIVFQGLVTAAQGADTPTIQIAGIEIDAGALMDQVLAVEAEPIETAAGEESEGAAAAESGSGGSSHYDDSFGDVISGLAKQGVIGETELGFGLIAGDNIELPVDTAALSNGHASSGGGFDPLEAGSPNEAPSFSGEPAAGSDSGESDELEAFDEGDGGLEPIHFIDMDIITNEATGNLEIPDELLLYLATGEFGGDVSVTGPSNDGGDNAFIWAVEDPGEGGSAPENANTWANHVSDNVKFHIGNVDPFYEGTFTYEISDEPGGYTIGVWNVETQNDHSYWTLDRGEDGSELGEVLLGQDGRNIIEGGGGNNIIHGGHDSSGDILMGGEGDDVIFGGSGNDDLQGDGGADNFIMSAGFGRDDVDGGSSETEGIDDIDTITLVGVLTQGDVDDLNSWLTLDSGETVSIGPDGVISLGVDVSGTIDLGGGDVITFENIEQIVYTGVA